MPIFVGLLTVDLYIAEADTLKEKRQVLQGLLERLQNRLNVAVAEVGDNDVHRHAQIAITTVSNSETQVQRVLAATSRFIDSAPTVIVAAESVEIL